MSTATYPVQLSHTEARARLSHLSDPLTTAQVAEYLGVSERTIRRTITAGRLRCYRISATGGPKGALRIAREDFAAFLVAASQDVVG